MQVLDKNSSGRISMAELSDLLENLGKQPTEVTETRETGDILMGTAPV